MKSCMWEGRSLPLFQVIFTLTVLTPQSIKRKYHPPLLSSQTYGTCFTTLHFPPVPLHPRLTLNRIFTLRRKTTLEKTGITHIVSVLKYDFKDFEDWEKYEHLNIEVDDVEDENLLGEFENSGKFIEDGLKNGKDGKKGGVLVHW